MPLALTQKGAYSKVFLSSHIIFHRGTSFHNLNYLEQVYIVTALLVPHIYFFKHSKYFIINFKIKWFNVNIREHSLIQDIKQRTKNFIYLITKSLSLFFKFLLSCQFFLKDLKKKRILRNYYLHSKHIKKLLMLWIFKLTSLRTVLK